jgi:hypothetical protein
MGGSVLGHKREDRDGKTKGVERAKGCFSRGRHCGTGRATDQELAGKEVLLKTGKLVLLSSDVNISVSGSDPLGGADSSVSFRQARRTRSQILPLDTVSVNAWTH